MIQTSATTTLGLPGTLVLLWFPSWLETRIVDSLGANPLVVNVQNVASAALTLQHTRGACLMLLVPSSVDPQLAADCERLLQWHRDVPVIAVYDARASDCRALLELGRIGVAEVIEKSELSSEGTLRDSLRRCQASAVSEQLWHLCSSHVPAALAAPLRSALSLANKPTTVAQLAARLNIPESALAARCARASLPGPKWIIALARLATFAYFVERLQYSMSGAVEYLQFANLDAVEECWRGLTNRTEQLRSLSIATCIRVLGRAVGDQFLTPRVVS